LISTFEPKGAGLDSAQFLAPSGSVFLVISSLTSRRPQGKPLVAQNLHDLNLHDLGLKETNDEWYRLVAQNELPLSAAPSVHELKTATKGMGIGTGRDGMHVHHMVEKRYQRRLNIPESELNDVPGFVIDAQTHNGSGGIVGRLAQEIGASNDPAVIIAGHRKVYREKGFNDL